MSERPCEACGGRDFRPLYRKDAHDFQRCAGCALIRIDPQPTDAVLAKIYGTQYYHAWGVQTGADRVFALKKATFRKHEELITARQVVTVHLGLDRSGAGFGAMCASAAAAPCPWDGRWPGSPWPGRAP